MPCVKCLLTGIKAAESLPIAQLINLTSISARKVPIAFLVSGGPVGIPDSEELTEEGQF